MFGLGSTLHPRGRQWSEKKNSLTCPLFNSSVASLRFSPGRFVPESLANKLNDCANNLPELCPERP
jgi:hypothetical protein